MRCLCCLPPPHSLSIQPGLRFFCQMEARKRALGVERGKPVADVWHMKQVVGNACGAVAIMHAVMNNLDRVGEGSSFLEGFRDTNNRESAAERGKSFQEQVRSIHSDIAAGGQTDAPKPTADLDFHFVAHVEVNGVLYELDGNNDGPIDCGPVGSEGLLGAAVAHVKSAYISQFPDSHFSLITLGPAQKES